MTPNLVLATVHNSSIPCTYSTGFAINILLIIWDQYLTDSPYKAYHCFVHRVEHNYRFNNTQNTDTYTTVYKQTPFTLYPSHKQCMDLIYSNKFPIYAVTEKNLHGKDTRNISIFIYTERGEDYSEYIWVHNDLKHHTWTHHSIMRNRFEFTPVAFSERIERSIRPVGRTRKRTRDYLETVIQPFYIQFDPYTKMIPLPLIPHSKNVVSLCSLNSESCLNNL